MFPIIGATSNGGGLHEAGDCSRNVHALSFSLSAFQASPLVPFKQAGDIGMRLVLAKE